MKGSVREVTELLAAAELLAWVGDVVGPVRFGGVTFWAVATLEPAEHAHRTGAGFGAFVDQREQLAEWLSSADEAGVPIGGPAVRLVGAIVVDPDPGRAIRDASLLAGYTERAILVNSAHDLMPTLVDAAVLDVGVVAASTRGLDRLATAGRRTGVGVFSAREWDLLEAVYDAWLASAAAQHGRAGGGVNATW